MCKQNVLQFLVVAVESKVLIATIFSLGQPFYEGFHCCLKKRSLVSKSYLKHLTWFLVKASRDFMSNNIWFIFSKISCEERFWSWVGDLDFKFCFSVFSLVIEFSNEKNHCKFTLKQYLTQQKPLPRREQPCDEPYKKPYAVECWYGIRTPLVQHCI